MKKKNRFIFIICVVFVFIGGLLPFLTSYFYDCYLNSLNDIKRLNISKIAIKENDVKDVLLLLADEHDELEYNGETNISILSINIFARTISKELIQQELLPQFNVEEATIKANVYLINSKSKDIYFNDKNKLTKYEKLSTRNAIVWRCDFYDINDTKYSIWIDDKSGKLVSMYYGHNIGEDTMNEMYQESDSTPLEELRKTIIKYNNFFTDYYNLENSYLVVNTEEKLVREYSLPIMEDNGYFGIVRLVIYDNVIYFNY